MASSFLKTHVSSSISGRSTMIRKYDVSDVFLYVFGLGDFRCPVQPANLSCLNQGIKPLIDHEPPFSMTRLFVQLILRLHSLRFSVSCGKIHPPSTQTASWVLTALSSTSWKGRRCWFLAWESAVASARSLHEMKSSSSWQSLSRSCTSSPCLESHWTWPQNTVSQWSTNAASWEPQCERGMSNDAIYNVQCITQHSQVKNKWKIHLSQNVRHQDAEFDHQN